MLARFFVPAFAAVLLLTMPAAAKEKTKASQVTCEGVFGPESSEALVKQTFGPDNVVTGMVDGPEGMQMLATTVFPDDPQRTMRFGWWDEDARSGLSYVDLAPSQIAPGGVRIGQTVAEVEALNGAPFTIGGFWWDYGGYANIENGNLAHTVDKICWVSIRFSHADDYSSDIDATPVSGEVQVPSGEALLEMLDVRVAVVSVSWPAPEGYGEDHGQPAD